MIEHLIIEALEEDVKKEVSELVAKFIFVYSFIIIVTIIHHIWAQSIHLKYTTKPLALGVPLFVTICSF